MIYMRLTVSSSSGQNYLYSNSASDLDPNCLKFYSTFQSPAILKASSFDLTEVDLSGVDSFN